MGGFMPMKFKSSQSGMSMIELLIAIGLFTIVIAMSQGQIRNMLQFNKNSGDRFQINQLSKDLMRYANCEKLATTPCSGPNDYLNIFNVKTGELMVSKERKTTYRGWSVMATGTSWLDQVVRSRQPCGRIRRLAEA
ncbi:prepilin-type N-terminal cleavage/methylation domain-containing protein [bacterium]|nr:MAG: prepilin-type N-terminal cleavage/methylation domain-containing protein [bacterium]